MRDKRCPKAGCKGVLIREENANRWINILFCSKCGNRYKKTKNNKLQKTKGHVEYIKCAASC